MENEVDGDERREASIASAAALRPNFKPTSGLTQSQLSKFQELHRRRLQIKSKSKIKMKKLEELAGGLGKSLGKNTNDEQCKDEKISKAIENSISPSPKDSLGNNSSLEQGIVAANNASTFRPKLHWGLDAKERWERKSNM